VLVMNWESEARAGCCDDDIAGCSFRGCDDGGGADT